MANAVRVLGPLRIVDAEGVRAARLKLKRQGVFATRVEEVQQTERSSGKNRLGFLGRGIGVRDLSLITRQLATLLGAGLPLVAALGLDGAREHARRLAEEARSRAAELGWKEGQPAFDVVDFVLSVDALPTITA